MPAIQEYRLEEVEFDSALGQLGGSILTSDPEEICLNFGVVLGIRDGVIKHQLWALIPQVDPVTSRPIGVAAEVVETDAPIPDTGWVLRAVFAKSRLW